MSEVTIINLPNHIQGDTFAGYRFNAYDENNDAYDLTGATPLIKFRKGGVNGTITATFGIGTGLTWITQTEGTFKIDRQVISFTPDKYYYEIQITLADTTVISPVKGTWTITNQIT